MRHRKHTFKIGRTASHRRCMIANMLISLITHGAIRTTITKAKELRRHADRMITLAKKNTLDAHRQIIAKLMHREDVALKEALASLSTRFAQRAGGYTRIVQLSERRGDNAQLCHIEFIDQ